MTTHNLSCSRLPLNVLCLFFFLSLQASQALSKSCNSAFEMPDLPSPDHPSPFLKEIHDPLKWSKIIQMMARFPGRLISAHAMGPEIALVIIVQTNPELSQNKEVYQAFFLNLQDRFTLGSADLSLVRSSGTAKDRFTNRTNGQDQYLLFPDFTWQASSNDYQNMNRRPFYLSFYSKDRPAPELEYRGMQKPFSLDIDQEGEFLAYLNRKEEVTIFNLKEQRLHFHLSLQRLGLKHVSKLHFNPENQLLLEGENLNGQPYHRIVRFFGIPR